MQRALGVPERSSASISQFWGLKFHLGHFSPSASCQRSLSRDESWGLCSPGTSGGTRETTGPRAGGGPGGWVTEKTSKTRWTCTEEGRKVTLPSWGLPQAWGERGGLERAAGKAGDWGPGAHSAGHSARQNVLWAKGERVVGNHRAAMPSSREYSHPGVEPAPPVSCTGRQVLYHWRRPGGPITVQFGSGVTQGTFMSSASSDPGKQRQHSAVYWWLMIFPDITAESRDSHIRVLLTKISKCAQSLSHVQLLAVTWIVVHPAPLPMEVSRQEYWSGLPFPPPGDLPYSGIESTSLVSPALAAGFFATSAT